MLSAELIHTDTEIEYVEVEKTIRNIDCLFVVKVTSEYSNWREVVEGYSHVYTECDEVNAEIDWDQTSKDQPKLTQKQEKEIINLAINKV
jgi:hypothetical protein|tara:strand:+ start:237 stop:506 length:270 start_codon:yes stop_codon:yes gene_type:complete